MASGDAHNICWFSSFTGMLVNRRLAGWSTGDSTHAGMAKTARVPTENDGNHDVKVDVERWTGGRVLR